MYFPCDNLCFRNLDINEQNLKKVSSNPQGHGKMHAKIYPKKQKMKQIDREKTKITDVLCGVKTLKGKWSKDVNLPEEMMTDEPPKFYNLYQKIRKDQGRDHMER